MDNPNNIAGDDEDTMAGVYTAWSKYLSCRMSTA